MTHASPLLAGAAACAVDPPLDLRMAGFVRTERTRERLGALEVTAAAFERGATRVVLCGVDTIAIQAPEADALRDRVAAATGAAREGVLLTWSHTHHAPPGGRSIFETLAYDSERREQALAYVATLHERIVEACRLAFERLEPAWPRWGLGFAEEGINRRERDEQGVVRPWGWDPNGAVDPSVPCLQAVRRDGSAIATVVGYACHPLTTDVLARGYSPDYVGPLRDAVRELTGGECVFVQGASGDVSPRIATDETGVAPRRLGQRLALEAVHALADRPGWPVRLVERERPTSSHPGIFRPVPVAAEPPALAVAQELVELPLMPPHDGGPASPARASSVTAVRIGDGAIVTGPGEVFAAIGLAVRERSPADVCLYAGCTNDLAGYLPTAAEHARGGYETESAHLYYGLPAPFAPACERILVETGVRLAAQLFPERPPAGRPGWHASGALPQPPPRERPQRPLSTP